MEALSLHKNQLQRLPSSIGRLTGVSRMSLYENQLTEVPPEIGDMANLQEL
jgi:Leucine-rich repeat (LRR) protein